MGLPGKGWPPSEVEFLTRRIPAARMTIQPEDGRERKTLDNSSIWPLPPSFTSSDAAGRGAWPRPIAAAGFKELTLPADTLVSVPVGTSRMRIGAKIGVVSPTVDHRVAADHAGARGHDGVSPHKGGEIPRLDVARALARLLGRVDQAAPDPVRAAQLEILRNAVATGRYQPDPVAVARKLLVEVAAEPRW